MDPVPPLPVSLGPRCIPAPNPGIERFSAHVLAAMSFHGCLDPEDKSLFFFPRFRKVFIPLERKGQERDFLSFPKPQLIHIPRPAHKNDFSGH